MNLKNMLVVLTDPRVLAGALKDVLNEGHPGNRCGYWMEMREASPKLQEKYYRDISLAPPHDTYLEKLASLNSFIRQQKPERILELGVKHGFSSYAILKAIEHNQKGFLISIDKNEFVFEGMKTGSQVPDSLKCYWRLNFGEATDLVSRSLERFDFIYEDLVDGRGRGLHPSMLPLLWNSLNDGGFLFIAVRTTTPEFDRFAAEKGGWFARAIDVKTPIASWGIMRNTGREVT